MSTLSLPTALVRRVLRAPHVRRSLTASPSSSTSSRSLHSTSVAPRQSRKAGRVGSSSRGGSSSSTIASPSPSALSALLARLALPVSTELHDSLIACLTHPSYFTTDHATADSTDSLDASLDSATSNGSDNELLASLGNALLGLFASEHLSTLYPHLPSTALKVGVTSLVGPSSCVSVARELGVGVVGGGAVEGVTPGKGAQVGGVQVRWRRRMDAGEWDVMEGEGEKGAGAGGVSEAVESVRRARERQKKKASWEEGVASVTRALVGLIYQEQGIHAARRFVSAHFLSRHLDPSSLFNFKNPRHVLSSVVAKHLVGAGVDPSEAGRIEARLLASSGTHTQAPLFSIGLFLPSGLKLAEGSGSSISMAYHRAATNALHSIFLVRSDSGSDASPSASSSSSSQLVHSSTSSASTSTSASTSSASTLNPTTSGTVLPTEAHGEFLISEEGGIVPAATRYEGRAWGGDEGIVGLARASR